jgi:hypothetical protein
VLSADKLGLPSEDFVAPVTWHQRDLDSLLVRGVGCAGWPTRNAVLALHIANVRKLATRLYFALISGGEVFPASLKPNYVHGYLSLFKPQWQVWIPSSFGIKKSAFFSPHTWYFTFRMVRVPGCRSRGQGSIPGATTFSEK